MSPAWPWVVLALLGAYHGLNPAMGWLFALAQGLQEKRASAIIGALLPIALGHAAAIGISILILSLAQRVLSAHVLKWPIAGIVFALGLYRIFRASHPRGSGMRVGGRDLFVWSFLMASAHGAGLMVIPVLMAIPTAGLHHSMARGMDSQVPLLGMRLILLSTIVHTATMLIVAGTLALLFFALYDRIGLKLLRHTWFNFDLLWAVALLIAAGALLWS